MKAQQKLSHLFKFKFCFSGILKMCPAVSVSAKPEQELKWVMTDTKPWSLSVHTGCRRLWTVTVTWFCVSNAETIWDVCNSTCLMWVFVLCGFPWCGSIKACLSLLLWEKEQKCKSDTHTRIEGKFFFHSVNLGFLQIFPLMCILKICCQWT